nr:MAG TPA: hypothetical protein [Microviridae sp.]
MYLILSNNSVIYLLIVRYIMQSRFLLILIQPKIPYVKIHIFL